MYHHVRGTLVRLTPAEAIVEAGGVGYRVEVPFPTYKALEECVGAEVTLFLVPYFREEGQRLFGFLKEEERDFFATVVAVRGFGPSHALALLSGLPLGEICEAIRSAKAELLQGVRGIGRKNAQRLIVELRERLPERLARAATEGAGGSEAETARLGLQGLGYSRAEAAAAIRKAQEALPDGTATEWIKYALQLR